MASFSPHSGARRAPRSACGLTPRPKPALAGPSGPHPCTLASYVTQLRNTTALVFHAVWTKPALLKLHAIRVCSAPWDAQGLCHSGMRRKLLFFTFTITLHAVKNISVLACTAKVERRSRSSL